jgi:hypothetical protein
VRLELSTNLQAKVCDSFGRRRINVAGKKSRADTISSLRNGEQRVKTAWEQFRNVTESRTSI